MYKNITLILLLFLGIETLFATHNRAGEITYRQIGPLTIELTITTYTKNSSSAADRDSLEVNWGDGTKQFVKRDNSRTRNEPNDIKVNFYTSNHTYPGSSTYTVSFQDPNRIGNILNVNFPNSIDIPFFLSTTFTLLDQQFQGYNSSAILLQPPIDIGCVNKLFIHNPNAYDPDGDSLAFELGVPLQAVNTPVPLYRLPDLIGDPNGNKISINPITGELRWESPKLQGEYNIAIRIKEYRNGKLINVILRDMQVLIRLCDNDPPTIESEEELCVIAGTLITIPLKINDPNPNQKVKLTATGGPFTVESPAVLNGPLFFTKTPFNANIEWQTNCDHINKEYYKIVLRAADNFYNDSTGLATLKTIRIKVIAPPPQNLQAQSADEAISLTWDKPYSCEITKNQYFQGFSVWRKEASSTFSPDTCDPGLSKSNYTKIAFKTTNFIGSSYEYTDTKITQGVTYCYRVQAEFARLTASGNPFNRVEGLPSIEACIVAMRDLPMITKVSVTNTDVSYGEIHLRWTKPLINQFDTIVNPRPYKYNILRAGDDNIFIKIKSINSEFFGSNIDTNFFDNSINTDAFQYSYLVEFESKDKVYGVSQPASSVLLTIAPSDKQLKLSWEAQTPWANKSFDIFKKDIQSGQFVKLTTTNEAKFTDFNLVNGTSYCYVVRTVGSYNIPNIENPLFNDSQISCAIPIDNVPPCPPEIKVINICDLISSGSSLENLYNTVKWSSPTDICPELAIDISQYKIYYAATVNENLQLIDSVNADEQNQYFHTPNLGLLGCYAVTAVDDKNNESLFSSKVCVDNCPLYKLPNTFTPNNDGYNDLFKPIINLFVSEIDLKIYNQWGNLVFKTTDPKINWDGTNNSGSKLPDGTYHYVCRIWENRVTGIIENTQPLSGFIHLLKN
jgi:gliding motility-associated-like protein